MKNSYGLPPDELQKSRERDRLCVYCHKTMTDWGSNGPRVDWRTIEHFNCSEPWDDPNTVGFCCRSCNSSKGNRELSDWFKRPYCISRNISAITVAEPVKIYLRALVIIG